MKIYVKLKVNQSHLSESLLYYLLIQSHFGKYCRIIIQYSYKTGMGVSSLLVESNEDFNSSSHEWFRLGQPVSGPK